MSEVFRTYQTWPLAAKLETSEGATPVFSFALAAQTDNNPPEVTFGLDFWLAMQRGAKLVGFEYGDGFDPLRGSHLDKSLNSACPGVISLGQSESL